MYEDCAVYRDNIYQNEQELFCQESVHINYKCVHVQTLVLYGNYIFINSLCMKEMDEYVQLNVKELQYVLLERGEWVECLECKFDGLVHESYVNVWFLMSCNHMVSLQNRDYEPCIRNNSGFWNIIYVWFMMWVVLENSNICPLGPTRGTMSHLG